METPLKAFRDEYLDLLLRFLWAEWTTLGVSGQDSKPVRHVIDPEALLLFTCSLGRYDPRLFDEALDWLAVNGRFLNVQRMKNILRQEPFRGGQVLSAVADWLLQRGDPLKWNLLARTAPPRPAREGLFYLADGRKMPDPVEKDTVFLAHGFARNPVVLRGYSRPFPADTMPCHLLKLRALLGVSSRCDVLAYLAMNRSGHPREIARETYYSQKAIHDVMNDMACSGVVQSARLGRERTYRISSNGLPFLTNEAEMPGWINWPVLLAAAETVWAKVEELNAAALDPLLEASEIALTMEPLLHRLAATPWAPAFPAFQPQHSLSLLQAFRDAFQSLAA